MKTKTAIMRQSPGEWEVVEVDLEPPRQGEVLLKMYASGLCHSDDRDGLIADPNGFAHHTAVAAEPPEPEVVGEHHHGRDPGAVVGR